MLHMVINILAVGRAAGLSTQRNAAVAVGANSVDPHLFL